MLKNIIMIIWSVIVTVVVSVQSDPFVSIPAIASLVIIVTNRIKDGLGASDNVQYVSWAVALILNMLGYLFGLGIYLGLEWYYIFIYAAASGLIANGLFDWTVIKTWLRILKLHTGPTIVLLAIMSSIWLQSCSSVPVTTTGEYGITNSTSLVRAIYNGIEEGQHIYNKDKEPFLIAVDLLPSVMDLIESYQNRDMLIKELTDLDEIEITALAGLSHNYNFGEYNEFFQNVMKALLYTSKAALGYSHEQQAMRKEAKVRYYNQLAWEQ